MVDIVHVERKSSVLNHPSLPCLAQHYTINLTAGCPNECQYCYAQSFQHHPGWGRVLFYANSLELLRRELSRKRRKPQLVYFSTACEPFVPHERILSCLYGIMELLLRHSISLVISTKCPIPEEFMCLFVRHPGQVHVQVGLVSADDGVRGVLEPHASTVQQRLTTVNDLISHDIRTEVRMDPLMPELTDTEESFAALCDVIAQHGVRQAVASYLFLRPANYGMLGIRYGGWSFREMARLYTRRFDNFCGHGIVWLPSTDYRRNKYNRFTEIAAQKGIALALCSCVNPDVTDQCCHPGPPEKSLCVGQTWLFEAESEHHI